MQKINEKIELCKLPYKHQFKMFSNEHDYINLNHGINDYYVYQISNPIQNEIGRFKSNFIIKVAVLVINKKTSIQSIEEIEFNFKTILYFNIFSKIDNQGATTPFEDNFNYKSCMKKFNINDIHIQQTSNFEVLNLKEVTERFNILNEYGLQEKEGFSDLEYYLYIIDGKQILIPAIEILKYFYLFNKHATLNSSFSNDILTPQGINASVMDIKIDDIKHYNFIINYGYSINDRYNILFFFKNIQRITMYSNVYRKFKDKGIISANIPRENVTLNVRTLDYVKENISLVLNIVSHDFENDFSSDLSYEYEHVQSSIRELQPKANATPMKKKKQATNKQGIVIDIRSDNDEFEYDADTLNEISQYTHFEPIDENIELAGNKKIRKRTRQPVKALKNDIRENKPATTTKKLDIDKNTEDGVYIEDNPNIVVENVINIPKIMHYVKNNPSFQIVNVDEFEYPQVPNGKISKNKSFRYIDKENKHIRKYNILSCKYNKNNFYVIELNYRYNLTTKPILLLFSQLDIDSMRLNYLVPELKYYLQYKNSSWFKNIDLTDIKYDTIKHHSSIENFIQKVKKHYD